MAGIERVYAGAAFRSREERCQGWRRPQRYIAGAQLKATEGWRGELGAVEQYREAECLRCVDSSWFSLTRSLDKANAQRCSSAHAPPQPRNFRATRQWPVARCLYPGGRPSETADLRALNIRMKSFSQGITATACITPFHHLDNSQSNPIQSTCIVRPARK